MAFDDRLGWLLIGVVIGFFLGYLTRTLREIKEEVHEVDEIVKSEWNKHRDEKGSINLPSWPNIALIIVILATVFAALQSQSAANKVKSTQDELFRTQQKLENVVGCNKELLDQTLKVLNVRTRTAEAAAKANLSLQQSQKWLLDVIFHVPPYSTERQEIARKLYAEDLKEFLDTGNNSEFVSKINRYPKAADLTDCIEDAKSGD